MGKKLVLVINDPKYMGRVGEVKFRSDSSCTVSLRDESLTNGNRGRKAVQFASDQVEMYVIDESNLSSNASLQVYQTIAERAIALPGDSDYNRRMISLESDLASLGIKVDIGLGT